MPRDPDKTRAALLTAASNQFRMEGFHGTDTNRIAREAGFSPQTFYRHFADKREAFLEVYRGWSATLLAAIEEASGAAEIARAVIEHHRRWAPFRASLVALSSTDDLVRSTRWTERRAQLKALRARTSANDAELLQLLWSVERVADGIATGEAAAMRVSERRMAALVVSRIDAVLG